MKNSEAIQDVDEFLNEYLEKCSIASLAQQWMLCSEWVPSEWESNQLIKTSHPEKTKETNPSLRCLKSSGLNQALFTSQNSPKQL